MPMQDGTGPRGNGRGQGRGQGQGRGRGPCGGGRALRDGSGGGRRTRAAVNAASPLSAQIAQLRTQLDRLETAAFAEALQ
ncbi:hypothetical protein SAMN05421644_10649 [Allochromatium warmingii]|uniref:Uncharacterized protein n=1 Tax=Allochromatium warmingii TaxID=61595 RepID=A0A1H3CKB5_ALLWA|nr:hypothetical protein [Allochromatium warmingii]SDX54692.1 hypothetical protein SAMN05421644_10649 [Allochromatium warmingii]